jgi:translocation and assembly module TamB
MRRRRLVALVGIGVLFTLGLLVVSTGWFLMRTATGREKVRSFAQTLIDQRIKGGTIYIGRLSGNFLTNLTIDSIAIRDKRGEYLAASGPVTVTYNPRDLFDSRLFIRRTIVEHPYVHIIQHANGVWNFKEIFASGTNAPKLPQPDARRGWGDYMVFDSTTARNATFLLTMNWQPDDSLKGAKRDSSIKAHLSRPSGEYVRTFDGYGRQYLWKNAHGLITHARLADPDSDRKFGMQFRIDTLSADEFEPTFKFRKVTGDVRRLADSLWFQVSHFEMPGSRGSGSGKLSWGSRHVQYDIAVRGDSVSLDDVNWVYPTLPRTGGGSLDLLIKNDPKNPAILDFKLVNMDVKTTKSRLTGQMSFGIGTPVLLVRDLNVRADPVDFDLIRAFSTKPFPDWQGQIVGTMTGRGGPLTHFVVDDARGVFYDAHVRGANSRFSGKGELDILNPANTTFHGFNVDIASLDLRTIEFLYPSFPRLNGTISGTAKLDSSWLDVRFSNADVYHRDGPGEPSHFTGFGRVTDADKFMVYDVTMDLRPLSMTMITRSPDFSTIPVRGLFSGPLHASGSSPDLEVTTSLQSASGAISFDGRVDLDTIGGKGYRGRGDFNSLNVTSLLERPTIPANTLNGHYEIGLDSVSDDLSKLTGFLSVALDRSSFDGMRLNPSHARVRFVDGQMHVDTLNVNSPAFTAVASPGGLGLPHGRPDSLRVSLSVDSLGGLRFLARVDSNVAATALPDSITGNLRVDSALVSGRLDSLVMRGTAVAQDLYFNAYRAANARIGFDLSGLPKSLVGQANVHIDTAVVAGVALDTIGGALRFSDISHAEFDVGAVSKNGPSVKAGGIWNSLNGVNDVLLSSARFTIGAGEWNLATIARIHADSNVITVDSLMLRRDSATIALRGVVPDTGAASGELRALHVPLRDLGVLAQLTDTLDGVGDLTVTVGGTKQAPVIDGRLALSSIKWSGLDIPLSDAEGHFRDRRLVASGNVFLKGQPPIVAAASLPLDLTLFSAQWGNDSLSGSVKADSADLSLIQALVGKDAVRDISGRITANIGVTGTPKAKVFSGNLNVSRGSVFVVASGVTLSNISGSISGATNAAGEDSIGVRLSANTVGKPSGSASIVGYVKSFFVAKPTFKLALGLNQFHALNRRSLADLYITSLDSVRLYGSLDVPKLEGSLLVDRSSIFLPDPVIARKQPVNFASDDSVGRVGQIVGGSAMFSQLMYNLTSSVLITLGNDVRLRSNEANVRLSGELHVAKSSLRGTRTLASGDIVPGLTLEGQLTTEGGTYNLNLGLVQREFQVLSGGTVSFTLADSWRNPTLDIKARHNVKQQGGDLGVIVNLHGPLLPYPELGFSATGVDYEIPPSDLISYLLTGKPGFDFLQNPKTSEVLASVLAPTLSAFASDRLRSVFGSQASMLQLQLGGTGTATDQSAFSRNSLSQTLFYGATLAAEQQFGENLFLSVNTGFCQFMNEGSSARLNNAFTNVGAKVEYRVLGPKLAVQVAYDPASEKRSCSGGQSLFGLVPSPPNFSFSLSHVWRF